MKNENENETNEETEQENVENVENNGEETQETSKPSSEYVKELLKEKVSLDPELHSNAMRLLDSGKIIN